MYRFIVCAAKMRRTNEEESVRAKTKVRRQNRKVSRYITCMSLTSSEACHVLQCLAVRTLLIYLLLFLLVFITVSPSLSLSYSFPLLFVFPSVVFVFVNLDVFWFVGKQQQHTHRER